MEPRLPAISDEDLIRAAPGVRYLVGQRLEQIWNVCEPHLDGTAPRPDHRYVETAARVLKEMSRLYRLDSPAPAVERETVPEDAARMVLAQLRELETRSRPQPDAQEPETGPEGT